MDPEDFRALMDANAVEPAHLQQNRDFIQNIAGVSPPRQPSQIPSWWEDYKSHISKKVNEELDVEVESMEDGEEIDEETEDNEVE